MSEPDDKPSTGDPMTEREQVVELGTKVTLLDCHVCVRDDTHSERVVIVHPDCCKVHGRGNPAEMITVPRELLTDLVDTSECWYDHHGDCQGHGWLGENTTCPHARGKALLGEATP